MIKRVSCVLRLLDSVLGTPLTAPQADLYINGEHARPVYKTGGYFVLIDLPEGEYRIGIRSAIFQPDEIAVRVAYDTPFNELRDVITVMMNPSPRHPAAHSGVSVTGRFSKGGGTVFYLARSSAGFKIAEDNAAVGSREIKLFSQSAAVKLPTVCLVNDKDAKKVEIIEVNGANGDLYSLAAPLRYPHKRSTELIPLVRYRCADDGEFFIKLPAGYKATDENGQMTIKLFTETEKGMKVHELTVLPKGESDVGTV